MLHPVGSLPPSVYWRRRIALLGSVIVLIALTAWVLRPGGGHPSAAGANSRQSSSNAALTQRPASSGSTTSSPPVSGTAAAGGSTPSSQSSADGSTTSAVPAACVAGQLSVAAVPSAPAFKVGDQPGLMLQVTNTAAKPCVQDLADSQVELRVYNGESRVWGSHDCEVQPGTALRTLVPGQAVRVSVTWSGLSSQPGCTGTRQRVGAGTYTLYAYLSGQQGTAAQFGIS